MRNKEESEERRREEKGQQFSKGKLSKKWKK
jgi:hypothetical protein